MTAIETDGLTKTFGGSIVAVDDLNLQVERGEVYGFLGPNGAGKSTTINLLLDFLQPTDGEARVFGYDAHEQSDRVRDRVGILPEDATPYDRLTGREHLEFARECKGVGADVDATLDRVGLDRSDADRPVSQYSKGMVQRLGLGMAVLGDPDLLILDEPSSGLDPNGMQEVRDLVREEAADGTAVFFSSHVLAEVEAVCDRVGVLDDGRLVAQDSIDALRDEVFSTCTIEVTLRSVPDDLRPGSVDGVRDVVVDGPTLRITCAAPSVKADVVAYLSDRATVADVISEQESLESVFDTLTDGGEGASAGEGDRTEATT